MSIRMTALVTGLTALLANRALPTKTVGDHQKGAILRDEGEVADRDERILQACRYNREIVLILGT